ncbi:MAG: chromosome segregation protein SMC [Chloroflexi bacterium]|nr:MAG: chromosome segregation protein SMC [Chloroflexota bacterium]
MGSIGQLTVEGYKSIRMMDLDLRPLNILIGANGVGKSNFISVFKFLYELTNENLQLYTAKSGGVDTFLYFGQQVTDSLSFRVEFVQNEQGLTNTYSCSLSPSADGVFVFEDESAQFHDRTHYPKPYVVHLGSGSIETQLNEEANSKLVRYVKKAMASWQIYHFHDTSESAKVKQMGDIFDNRFLRQDASNLAAYLYLLRETEVAHYQNIVEVIRMIAPFFNDFALRPSPFNLEKIRLEWREKGTDMILGANALSDGTLRFISLATLLLQPTAKLPTTIILDEPELGLHPYAITILANLLQSAAVRTQVIVSTQSVTLVNQFNPEDIIVVDRKDGQSDFRHLPKDAIDNWLEDYGLGDLWEKNILGGRPT